MIEYATKRPHLRLAGDRGPVPAVVGGAGSRRLGRRHACTLRAAARVRAGHLPAVRDAAGGCVASHGAHAAGAPCLDTTIGVCDKGCRCIDVGHRPYKMQLAIRLQITEAMQQASPVRYVHLQGWNGAHHLSRSLECTWRAQARGTSHTRCK